MEYQFKTIEKKWQTSWKNQKAYQVSNQSNKPKCYVLDMFPYPSGAGLHVGHPLGYIASDIYSRYKRLKGFNVLHPMGYDAFGLPAEQYAIEHGVHPSKSTHSNIDNFRSQLDNIGFCYDWDREVRTCDATYYKWTQWIFLQLFNSYFDRHLNKANPISALVKAFEAQGNLQHTCPADADLNFTAANWNSWDEKAQQDVLMQYRLAFCGFGEVNWCAALGTVLANDEVINGFSERGGHPVEKKKLRQWYLRITEYADRLLAGLDTIQFSDAMKEMQANWIGKSYGAEIDFKVADQKAVLTVYTTRPDTVFGVDFLVVAPEHALIQEIVPASHQQEVNDYIAYVKSRSERERIAEKKITGCFTGAYVVNPFNQQRIPIWISEYVLAGYGTGAIMAVPCGDDRDFKFAQHFNIPITNIIGDAYDGTAANPTKEGILSNSDFLNGMIQKDAIAIVIEKLEAMGIGKKKVNFRMRDAAFSRQRYWGEPFPIQWKNGIAYPLSESELPLLLPTVENYGPGPDGEGPLANIEDWKANHFETNTMPGFAGSSWYFLRYMDPHNTTEFCDRKVSDYWGQVDLYIGGTEHAVGHLLYSRMWTKALYDLGHIGFDEPFKKLLNQGMIQGSSRFVYRKRGTPVFVSAGLAKTMEVDQLHVDVNIVDGQVLDTEAFKKWKPDYANATFELEDGKYICGVEVEKMSKSKFNTVNPDVLVDKYGADTFRMYEMFLGPVEQSKPWDTKGIEGVHRFLKKLWRLFYDEMKGQVWLDEKATPAELKVLHKTIKKIEEDTERHSYNTAVSSFMICVNELFDLGCHKKEVLSQVLVLLAPYAPHISEELWSLIGNQGLVIDASFPIFDAQYVTETSKEYPVSINGKVRTNIAINLEATEAQVHEIVLNNVLIQKWIEGKPIKKLI
ncbi:MAG: leucine--tRNA ligase, partial [Chitinophagaceae bacterium]|nr:leucine--tRNA ligase [Chitinophagaceae bacterium]